MTTIVSLNVERTKEIVFDFRRVHTQHAPLTINGWDRGESEAAPSSWVYTSQRTSPGPNNTAALAKKAQQRLYFLRKKEARAPAPSCAPSTEAPARAFWLAASLCGMAPQRVLPQVPSTDSESSWEDRWCLSPSPPRTFTTPVSPAKPLSIAGDPTHPTHNFFSLLPSGRRLRSLQARTNRLKDSFIHQAVRKLNSLPSLPPLPSLTPRITDSDPHPTTTTHTNTHTHTQHTHSTHWDKHRSLVQHWTDLIHSTTSSGSLKKKTAPVTLIVL